VQVGLAAGVGRVVAAGARAGELLDRRVLIGPIDPCGECDVCRRGGAAVCPRARRRDHVAARAIAAGRWLVALGDGLDLPVPAAAAVAGDVALAYTLYARTGAGPREPVIVVGPSPVARFLVEILLAKGVAPIAVAEPGPWHDWLRARGVATARDRASLDEALHAQSLGTRPWRLICGDAAAIPTATELAGPRATLTLLATTEPLAIGGGVLAREVTIIGVAGAHPDLVVEAAAMCAKGEIDLSSGITEAPGDPLRTQVHTSS
jgi:6-hydroxycyclohex-1-ene-1-carbonyl-CoA dehydrogenase